MLSYFNWKVVSDIINEHTLGVPRGDMPQIDDHYNFRNWCLEHGYNSTVLQVPTNKICLTQKNFDIDKISEIYHNDPQIDHLTISSDYFILDGHHRFIAWAARNRHTEKPMIRSHVDIGELIKLGHSYNRS